MYIAAAAMLLAQIAVLEKNGGGRKMCNEGKEESREKRETEREERNQGRREQLREKIGSKGKERKQGCLDAILTRTQTGEITVIDWMRRMHCRLS